MPPVCFEPTISAGEWPQTHALDRAATGTGQLKFESQNFERLRKCAVDVVLKSDFRLQSTAGTCTESERVLL